MPLPTDPNAPWPPEPWQPVQRDMDEAAVWYAGDTRQLETFYANDGRGATRPSDKAIGAGILSRAKFWARRSDDTSTDRQRLHAPAASDIAATSADLLFGDEPRLTIPEAHEETAEPAAKKTEDRLLQLADEDGWASTLIDAAEIAAGLGLVFLRPVWDRQLADRPLLTVVHGDHAVPEYRHGQLVAVTFWRVVQVDGRNAVWRHLERYERGAILHGLYVGTWQALGQKVALSTHEDTKALDVNDDGVVEVPDELRGELLVRQVPNALNRKHRGWPVGRADTAGCEGLMDSLDETWTSLVRDIRLAKARLVVPDEFLDRGGRGGGASFDTDAEIFSPLNMDPANMEKAGITFVQAAIRAEDHIRAATELFQTIVQTAGYSPQSFGMQGDGAQITATEVDAKQSKSFRTTARKQRHWRRATEDIAEMMLVLDAVLFGSGVEPMRPRLEFPDPDDGDPRKVAETLNLLAMAQAASIEARVKMAQPDLEGEELAAEVQRIKDEQGLGALPDPTGFPPPDDPEDGAP